MSNEKETMAVDSIIEFCQKQMDNDSSIHKGVYLSIIKFCKEQITEESEVHWKTTLITSKPMEMTNNKQQTAVEWLLDRIEDVDLTEKLWENVKQQAKEMERDMLTDAYHDGKVNGMDISHPLSLTKEISAKEYYEKTYGGNK